MLIVDSGSLGSYCLQYATADVLQRAGYSVWTNDNPCLEGIRMIVDPAADFSWRLATLNGYNSAGEFDSTPDVSVSLALDAEITLRDVQLLAAKFIESPGFRKMVRTTSASESAALFSTTPFDPDEIRRACGEGWPSSPDATE
jgi:hypothetical protein